MKKSSSKIMAWALALCMAMGNISFAAAEETQPANEPAEETAAGNTPGTVDQILWNTSFEDGEVADFKESTLDPSKGTKGIDSNLTYALDGDVTYMVDINSVTGIRDHNERETKKQLFDSSPDSKFLTEQGGSHPTAEAPVWVEWSLTEKKALKFYRIVSANDAEGRDPKAWKLFGKNDGMTEWVLLDEQSDVVFEDRFEEKEYPIAEDKQAEYKNYRIEITENFGGIPMTQFADIKLLTGNPADNQNFDVDGMVVSVSNGPKAAWNQESSKGFSGAKAVEVLGSVNGDNPYCYNIIYDNLDIAVSEKTYLEYLIFPSMSNGGSYDYDYTQMYVTVDLKFDDGKYLSELGAVDQNQNRVDPVSQVKSRSLTTNQWNQIYSRIGDVAAGKKIKQVLLVYNNNERTYKEEDLNNFITYFDDIKIYNKTEPVVEHLSDYTYILRGTNDSPGFSRGLTAPAVTMPHGFNFWAPATNYNDNKIYDYQDTQLRYITVSHEPSYWVGDRGTWQFMINTEADATAGSPGMGSSLADFSHENEIARSYYYSVEFDKEKGTAKDSRLELAPTEHGAAVRFTYGNTAANHNVIFDCVRAGGGVTFATGAALNVDGTTGAAITTFSGTSNHASNGSKRMYVYGYFDTQAKATNISGRSGIASFDENVVVMKIATSYISAEQAKKNLDLEIAPEDAFDDVRNRAQKVWDDKLGIISDVKGATYEQLVSLYSNLYRLFAYPNIMSENVGAKEEPKWMYKSPYRGSDEDPVEGKIYINNGFWDTYRTAWAAYGLLTPSQESVMLDGLAQHYIDQGWVPRWIAPGGTNSMVGTSSDVIFADAMVKEIPFDYKDAYESALRNAATVSRNLTNGGRSGLERSNFLGYAPGTSERFSWSMEGYINDFGIANMAEKMAEMESDPQKKAEYEAERQYYLNRAKNYVNLFCESENGELESWFRGKTNSGEWTSGNDTDGVFDPLFWGSDFTETNAYNMAVSVPQDGQGLANLYGGRDKLANKIDSIMETDAIFNGYGAKNSIGGIHEQKEAREIKLGQYGHSNQPAHHIIYMYNYAEQPWKTQKYVRDVLDRCYIGSTFGQGYIGDEDNGEMSAWYILSALGFYPVSMGSDEYAIGSPLFEEVTLNLEDGKTLVIKANHNSRENVYVQDMKVNGQAYTKSYIKHKDLINAGTIEFTMGSAPNEKWGVGEGNLPASLTKDGEKTKVYKDLLVPKTPVVEGATPESATVYVDKVTSDVENPQNLMDNTSTTESKMDENAVVAYSMNKGKNVEMFTLTSGSYKGTETDSGVIPADKAPTWVKLYGAHNGGEWVELASYENLEFKWEWYTRPFMIPADKQGDYEHYKFVFDKGTIAEIELLTYADDSRDRTDLGNLIVAAKEIAESDGFNATLLGVLNQRIQEAEGVYNIPDGSIEQYTEAYNKLSNAIVVIKGGYVNARERMEAEDFDAGNVSIDRDPDGKPHNIGGVLKDYWASYKNVLFRGNINSIIMNYAAQGTDAGGWVDIYIDGTEEENLVGKIDTPITTGPNESGWDKYNTVSGGAFEIPVSGLHDVYLVFRNDGSHAYVANVDWFQFNGNYQVIIDKGSNGKVEASKTEFEEAGGESKITIQADPEYKISTFTINGKAIAYEGDGSGKVEYTIKNIEDNMHVTVTFRKIKEDVNKDELKKAYEEAAPKLKEEKEYSPLSFQNFKKVMEAADALLKNDDAEQAKVDEAVTAIRNAVSALQPLTGIMISKMPSKVVYPVGSSIDVSDMEVRAVYKDNST